MNVPDTTHCIICGAVANKFHIDPATLNRHVECNACGRYMATIAFVEDWPIVSPFRREAVKQGLQQRDDLGIVVMLTKTTLMGEDSP